MIEFRVLDLSPFFVDPPSLQFNHDEPGEGGKWPMTAERQQAQGKSKQCGQRRPFNDTVRAAQGIDQFRVRIDTKAVVNCRKHVFG